MRIAIFLFACAVWWCQQQAELPSLSWSIALGSLAFVLGLVAACLPRQQRRFMLPMLVIAAPVFGFAWAAGYGHWRLSDVLPHASEGRDIEITGVVATLAQRYGSGVRFEFDVESASASVPRRIGLSWYAGQGEEAEQSLSPIHPGERWQLTVRLKRPRGNINPHGFDYEALLFERGIRATGYVRDHRANQRLAEFVLTPETLIERGRERVRERIQRVLGDADFGGVIVALVVGDQRAIEQEFWTVFNRSGITHLMAISGFHITMIAAVVGFVAGFIWRRFPRLVLRLPAQKFALVCGWLAALGYCLIAGMGVPAQRTLLMLTIAVLALMSDRRVSASRTLCAALAAVLLMDPLAVVAAGFWLSFGAVAVLMFACNGGLVREHWLVSVIRSQWAVTLGLAPFLLALFGQFSIISPIANALAIPVVTFVVTPLALLGAFLPLDLPLVIAHQVLAWMMVPIEFLAAQPWAVWVSHAPPAWAVVLATLGCLVLFMPRGVPMRWLGLLMALPMVLVLPERPAPGQARMTVLDVGQGLSVHVQTAKHDLVFDTGPQFSADANSGNRVIVPYLRAIGVRQISTLVISHEDRDHSGGVHSVAEALPIAQVLDSLDERSAWRPQGVPAERCRRGQGWEWEGVRFDMLGPLEAVAGVSRNDGSCVLRVIAGGQRVLIAADIEAAGERALLAHSRDEVRAEVLIVPHHGSSTSSTPEFIAAVGAQTAIFPVGYRNRYRHPNKEVWRRYADSGASLLRTDRDGALSLTLGAGSAVERSRAVRRRYWHDVWADR